MMRLCLDRGTEASGQSRYRHSNGLLGAFLSYLGTSQKTSIVAATCQASTQYRAPVSACALTKSPALGGGQSSQSQAWGP